MPAASRLRAPAPDAHLVRRPRLERLLDDLTSLPATLVVAPAGTGKTALVADWVRRTSSPVAWVEVEESGTDPVAFWTLVVAALDRVAPGCWSAAEPRLRTGDVVGALDAVEEPLAKHGEDPVVLVVDNVHLLEQDPDTAHAFFQFLERPPSGVRHVLLSRRRPEMAVDRLRAAGRLTEIGFQELRLSTAESAAMLALRGPDIPRADVARLARRADGWAAALHLMALAARLDRAARRATDEGPTAADEMLDRYLRHEVLADAPAELVGLLADTCMVERVNAGLAQTLTRRSDAGALLAEAERRSLMVTRLTGGWFEVHALVRELLQAELDKDRTTRILDQHTRAARWYEDSADPVNAVKHWIDAGRYRKALELLAASMTELYDRGEQSVTVRLMQRVPPIAARGDLRTMQNLALCQLAGSSTDFLETVAALEVYEQVEDGVTPVLRGRTKILQLMAHQMTGHWADDADLASRGLAQLGPGALLDPIGRFTWNEVARGVALTESWREDASEVVRVRAELSFDAERRLALEGTRALGLALSGRPIDALRVAAGVWRTASHMENLYVLRAEVSLAEALASSELGDEPRGRGRLADLAATDASPVTFVQVLAALALVEGLVDQGDTDASVRELSRAEALVRTVAPGPEGMSALSRVGVIVALADGDVRRARGWYTRSVDPFWAPLSLARIHLAEDEPARAREALENAWPRCPRHEVVRGLLRAVASESADEAEKHVVDAIEAAADLGLLTTVAAEGFQVRELIERAAWRVPQDWLMRLRRRTVPRGQHPVPRPVGPEPLTDRELEVLRLLPSRLTAREIADELYVSANTLKFHLRLIYRKLGVHGRKEAVDAARRMGLQG